MHRPIALVFAISLFGSAAAWSQPVSMLAPDSDGRVQLASARDNLGGGFIEFLFGDHGSRRPMPQRQDDQYYGPPDRSTYARSAPAYDPMMEQPAQQSREIDPRYERQEVDYDGPEKPGTVVIDTPNKFLYLVEPGGKAMRYGVGVGRPGFTWSGVHHITAKKEWPDWVPPPEMLKRQPYLPHFMAGGPDNPLGARALYIGGTMYRIHGSNEPWTIGHNVSSGCIRLRNADVIDLYGRVPVGAKVVVM
jgi:lipoprotein-anchoring transpeptidase ErfK/SrfK